METEEDFPDLPPKYTPEEMLMYHLVRAEQHLYAASEVVYTDNGLQRGLIYRLKLNHAQSIAMNLFNRETVRKNRKEA